MSHARQEHEHEIDQQGQQGQQGQDDVGEDERRAIEEERAQRLANESRPDGAEVDNTDRDFDPTRGLFTDSPDYEQAPEAFPDPSAEDPTKG